MTQIMTFGDWIKGRRKTLDLTQEELAARVGCATSTLKKIELEERRPSREMAERLAQALGLSDAEQKQFVQAARGTLAADEWLAFPPAAPMVSMADRQLLKGYELREQLGVGAFGEVYRAVQPVIGREVAIKVIRPQYANQPTFIRRFEVEAQLVARLEHPHIVPLYDYWRDPSGAYLVMRYIRSGNLHVLVKAGPVPLARVLSLLEQIGGALAVAHGQGVVHRDLKPSNILLDEGGNAYLADFGIAKDLCNANVLDPTATDGLVSSPAYSSPEQILGDAVTPQTDIYSLGILLYELLTGVHPFNPTTSADLIVKHLQQTLPALAPQRPDVPTAVDDVLQRATAKDPAGRYPDVASFLGDLRHLLLAGNGKSTPAFLEQLLLHNGTGVPVSVTANGQPTPRTVVGNPYKGLRAFQEADAGDFFGREALTQHLIARLAERGKYRRFLAVVGPSGSGKSSVVRAGLVPALRSGALPAAETWFVAEMLPGASPVEELATALLRVAVDTPGPISDVLRADEHGLARVIEQLLPADETTELVLVVDQFEELFTLVEDEAERLHFLNSLRLAVSDPRSRLRVVVTLRADFYDRPLQYAGFGELVRQRTAAVVALTTPELERAIIEPAARKGLRVEAALVAAMVADVDHQPGTLPLLQYALTDLFIRQNGGALTLEAYRAHGGLLGALASRADQLYEELDAGEQVAARQLFLRLVMLGEGVEDTRRRVRLVELAGIGRLSQALDHVIERYTTYRLLTLDRDPATRSPTVEVAHEALIRTWARLRAWIEASREDLRVQRRLSAAAAAWHVSGRDSSFLVTGAQLEQFTTWSVETPVQLNEEEQAYLQESLRERDRLARAEQARQERALLLANESAAAHRSAAQRLRYLAGLLTLFLVVALLLSTFAFRSRAAAIDSFAQSESQRLAAEANGLLQRGESAELAALLAVRGLRADYTAQADIALQHAARSSFGKRLFSHPGAVPSLAFSADGTQLFTGNHDNVARLWDLATGQVVREFKGHTDWVKNAVFSPDRTSVLTNSEDRSVRLWDTQTGQELRRFVGHTENTSVVFTPDGRFILTTTGDKACLWDRETGAQHLTITAPTLIRTATLSHDGRYILTGAGNDVQLWDAATGQRLRSFTGHTDQVMSAVFSPDQHYILTAARDETARLWDTSTGAVLRVFAGHTEQLFEAVFAPDAATVLTASLDTTARLWNVATGAEVRRFAAHTAAVYAVAFSPDSTSAFTASKDGTVRQWDLAEPPELDTLVGHTSAVEGLAFSPDGNSLLTGSVDQTAILWDVATRRQQRVMEHPHVVSKVAFTPDGRTLLTSGGGGVAKLWDRETGAELHTYGGRSETGFAVLSADGRLLVTSGEDTSVRVWNTQTGALVNTFGEFPSIGVSAALSGDGTYLITASDVAAEGNIRLWDVATGKQLHAFTAMENIVSIAFAPDGVHVLTGGRDNTARLWNSTTGQLVREFTGHTNIIWNVAFAADGRQVLTASLDKTARLWDVATGQQVRVFLGHGNAAVGSATLSADGRIAAVGSFDGVTQLMDTDVHALINAVCARALRDFTADERRVYSIRDAGPTCSRAP